MPVPGTATGWAGELPQPGPVDRSSGPGHPWAVARYPDTERAGDNGAGHRRGHGYRLAVDGNREPLLGGADNDPAGGQHPQAAGAPAAQQEGGLAGTVHGEGDHAQDAAVEPGAAAQAGQVAGSVGVVGHQQRLGRVDERSAGLHLQAGTVVSLQQAGQRVQRGAEFVPPVGRSLHDLGVGTEGGVVDEGPAVDQAEVDPQLDPVAQGVQASRRVLAVQPEVEGEMVPGACADHEERDAVLGGDAGHQGLGAVTARDAEQVSALGDRLAGHGGDVDVPWAAEQEHLGAERLSLALQVESTDFSAA